MEIKNGLLYVNGELPLVWTLFAVLFLLSDPIYLIWFYWLLKKYREQILLSHSNINRINLNWLNLLFYVCAISSLILFPLYVLSLGRKRHRRGLHRAGETAR